VTIQHESSLNGIEYSFPADELGYGLKVNRDYVILALLVGGTPATGEVAELEIETIQKREGNRS
jgi:hypothetical protein